MTGVSRSAVWEKSAARVASRVCRARGVEAGDNKSASRDHEGGKIKFYNGVPFSADYDSWSVRAQWPEEPLDVHCLFCAAVCYLTLSGDLALSAEVRVTGQVVHWLSDEAVSAVLCKM